MRVCKFVGLSLTLAILALAAKRTSSSSSRCVRASLNLSGRSVPICIIICHRYNSSLNPSSCTWTITPCNTVQYREGELGWLLLCKTTASPRSTNLLGRSS